MKASTIAILVFALGLFLTAIAWPQTISGVYVGVDLDKVGLLNLTPDGRLDNHIKITNIKSAPIDVRITDDSLGVWEHPFNGKNWEINSQVVGTTADLWFAAFNLSKFFLVTLTYADKTTDTVNVPVLGGSTASLVGQITVTAIQTLCSSSYINADASLTISYWADVPPCLTQVNTPLLKLTIPQGGAVCAQRQATGTIFDLWMMKTLPCIHP